MSDIIMYDVSMDAKRVATQEDWDNLIAAIFRLRDERDDLRDKLKRLPASGKAMPPMNWNWYRR